MQPIVSSHHADVRAVSSGQYWNLVSAETLVFLKQSDGGNSPEGHGSHSDLDDNEGCVTATPSTCIVHPTPRHESENVAAQ